MGQGGTRQTDSDQRNVSCVPDANRCQAHRTHAGAWSCESALEAQRIKRRDRGQLWYCQGYDCRTSETNEMKANRESQRRQITDCRGVPCILCRLQEIELHRSFMHWKLEPRLSPWCRGPWTRRWKRASIVGSVIGSRRPLCSAWVIDRRFRPFHHRQLFAQSDRDGPASIVEVSAPSNQDFQAG
jgi:hypothetical protein